MSTLVGGIAASHGLLLCTPPIWHLTARGRVAEIGTQVDIADSSGVLGANYEHMLKH